MQKEPIRIGILSFQNLLQIMAQHSIRSIYSSLTGSYFLYRTIIPVQNSPNHLLMKLQKHNSGVITFFVYDLLGRLPCRAQKSVRSFAAALLLCGGFPSANYFSDFDISRVLM